MTQTPFDLDMAIDAVARQLTQVEHDPHLAARIARSLPERSSWSLAWWLPRLAMIAVVVIGGGLWSVRDARVVRETAPLRNSRPHAVPTELAASVEPLPPSNFVAPSNFSAPNRTRPLEPLEPLEPLAPLILESLPEDAPLTLAPLAITDLPAAESISPR